MGKIMEWVAKFALGKYAVVALAWLHDKLDGRRSEIVLGIAALVFVLKKAGILVPEVADAIEAILLPQLPALLADRASKVKKALDGVAPDAKPQ
jgi:hypothetical protein